MKVKVSIEELQRHSLASIEVWDGKKLEYLILEATPLEEVKECSPHVFNNIDMNPECLKCGSPKQKEGCCQGKWVHSKDCPVLKQIKRKQEIELPEDINMKEVGEYAAKTDCGITEALTYILWIRYNKLLKYLKQ